MGQAPTEDSVVGSGATGDFLFNLNARSGPSGENPTGAAGVAPAFAPDFRVGGPVTCLNVTGNHAVIGIEVTSVLTFVGLLFPVTDGTPDSLGVVILDHVPTVCPATVGTQDPVVSGDIVVTDAPPLPTSIDQCKNGGWRNFPGFTNQGDCVSFVATGGRNQPSGH
jgi:hypothetical protein